MTNLKYMEERIVSAAIWYNDGKRHLGMPNNIKRGFVLYGKSHYSCNVAFLAITSNNRSYWEDTYNEQVRGFITDKNRFICRKEAYEIAIKASQIVICFDKYHLNEIGFVIEDLYVSKGVST